MLSGKYPEIFALDDINKSVMYQYLDETAKRKDMTYEELLKDDKALKETMVELEDAVDLIKGWDKLSESEFQDQLNSFYHGDVPDEIPDQDIHVVRAFVDYSAAQCGEKSDVLLSGDNPKYAKYLKEGAVRFGRALEFFKTTSLFSNKTMSSMVASNLKKVTTRSDTYLASNTTTDTISSAATSSITDSNGVTIQNMYVG